MNPLNPGHVHGVYPQQWTAGASQAKPVDAQTISDGVSLGQAPPVQTPPTHTRLHTPAGPVVERSAVYARSTSLYLPAGITMLPPGLASSITSVANVSHLGKVLTQPGNKVSQQPNVPAHLRAQAMAYFVASDQPDEARMKAAGLYALRQASPNIKLDQLYAISHLVDSGKGIAEKTLRMQSAVSLLRNNPGMPADQIDAVTDFANLSRTPDECALRLVGARRMLELNPNLSGEALRSATNYVENGTTLRDRGDRMDLMLDALRRNPQLTGRQLESFARYVTSGSTDIHQAWNWLKTAPQAFHYS